MQSGVLTKSRTKPRNVLRGIVPTTGGWDTPPSDLANATDGDYTTATGTGTKIMEGAGTYSYVYFDLGSVKTFILGGKLSAWVSANAASIYIAVSDNNSDWRNLKNNVFTGGGSSETIDYITSAVLSGRYIRFNFYVSGAATCNLKLYEISAYEVGV